MRVPCDLKSQAVNELDSFRSWGCCSRQESVSDFPGWAVMEALDSLLFKRDVRKKEKT